MTVKLRILSVVSAFTFLASAACFTAYAAELLENRTGDEEPVVPAVSDVPVDSVVSYDPVPDVSYEPVPDVSYEPVPDASDEPNPDVSNEPSPDVSQGEESTYSYTYSDLIDESNYPQVTSSDVESYYGTVSDYNDYNQNNNYVNPYSTVYDDNYVYVPSYTEPENNLVNNSSKVIDTDELTEDDWAKIVLDLEKGNVSGDGTQTFNFIKDNDTKEDTSIAWMLYFGIGLIIVAVFTVMYVIVSTSKVKRNEKFA